MLKRILFAALAALLAQGVLAETEGDPERGSEIAFTCMGCHAIPYQVNVYPTYRVPRLGGQPYGYIVNSLKAYRSGERRHATMQAQANTLSDEDIHDIAAYLVSLHAEDDS